MQENDGSVKFGNGSGSSATETAKKREIDASNLEKVFHYLEMMFLIYVPEDT